tara:strand:+ start:214 stop:1044 length:831 start_codon:yes stop_codon:yes gene_type:complete
MSLYPSPTTYEFTDEFRDSPFYKDAENYSGPQTADVRYNPFTGKYGGSSDFNRYKNAYDKFLTERSKPADFDESQALPEQQPFRPTTMRPGPAGQFITPRGGFNPFMGGMFGSPFGGMMGGYQRPSFGRPPMMGGFGGFGGYGSPFGGLGMFGMSPYGGMPNYGMFGGMMSPYMGGMGGMFGGGGMNRPPAQPVPRGGLYHMFDTRGQIGGQQPPTLKMKIEQQQQMMPSQPTQQPFQSPNPFMNPFMSGLGSMMGNMFGGGYGSNVSNTQANVAQ